MKTGRKVLALIICVFITISSLTGCFLSKPKDKEFSVSGMSITLTDEFFEKDFVGYTAYYQSTDVLVFVLKESKSDFPAEYRNQTAYEYAQLVCDTNNLEVDVVNKNTYADFKYSKEASGKNYYYYARCYNTDDSYWLVQFACFENKKDEFSADMDKWANSIKFENN